MKPRRNNQLWRKEPLIVQHNSSQGEAEKVKEGKSKKKKSQSQSSITLSCTLSTFTAVHSEVQVVLRSAVCYNTMACVKLINSGKGAFGLRRAWRKSISGPLATVRGITGGVWRRLGCHTAAFRRGDEHVYCLAIYEFTEMILKMIESP